MVGGEAIILRRLESHYDPPGSKGLQRQRRQLVEEPHLPQRSGRCDSLLGIAYRRLYGVISLASNENAARIARAGGRGMNPNPLTALFGASEAGAKAPERFLTVGQFARAVGCRTATVRADIRAGMVPFVRFGKRRLRIPASFLEKAAEQAWNRYFQQTGQTKP
jgi:excisionase family DNA binding protein